MPARNDEDALRNLWQVVCDKVSHDAAMDNRVGSRVGPYLLTRRLGEGGMDVVYQAQRSELGEREFAIKFIKPHKKIGNRSGG